MGELAKCENILFKLREPTVDRTTMIEQHLIEITLDGMMKERIYNKTLRTVLIFFARKTLRFVVFIIVATRKFKFLLV